MVAGPGRTRLLDTLAVFGAEAEDRENDLEDERDEGEEDDSDSDNALDFAMDRGVPVVDDGDREPDFPRERRRYIEDRQLDGVTHNGITYGRYDNTKDWDEFRRVERALAERALARR